MKFKLLSVYDISLISVFAAVIAVCSAITVPFAVPFTLQIFGVFLCIGMLGMKKSVLCIVAYVLLGITGVPVFSGFQGGLQVLFGQTGGFILGFVISSFVSGFLIDRVRNKFVNIVFSMFLGLVVCYICGSVWLLVGFEFDFRSIFLLLFPLFMLDILKIILAAFLTIRLKKVMRGNK